ncbi:MAG: hypothetical protein JSV12_07770 [Candidatus Bathyarchaeota archaeon]|nr:MAG: hypothetical protein JSV12_07770 [Candidatus Bathyarchaeota archaeon]
MRFEKVLRHSLVMLTCLILISTIARSGVVVMPTKADPAFPWEPLTLVATKTDNPYWGYYGGYNDLWEVVKSNLSEIGITLDTSFTTDAYSWWSRVWDIGWNKTHQNGGWDVTMLEWRLQPHALVPRLESLFTANMTPPEGGNNIFHWNNTGADVLLRSGIQASDALQKKQYLWRWQEWFLHDPPAVNVYNPRVYDAMGSYISGYNPMVEWYDVSHLTVNATKFNNVVTNVDRLAVGANTTIYAVTESVWALLPFYTESYTEEKMWAQLWRPLYKWTIKDSEWYKYMDGSEVAPQDWDIVPDIAAIDPIIDPDGTGNKKKARVVIRDNVKWSDNEPLTVHDVLFTFNTCTLNPATGSTGYADFANMIKNVTYYNETAVDFYLNYEAPMIDLKSCLANDWGGGSIMPFHELGGYMDHPEQLRNSPYNTGGPLEPDPAYFAAVTGPFKMVELVVDDHATFERNDLYFGYDESIVGSPAWGPYNINKTIFEWIPDAPARFLALKNNDVDFGEYSTASVGEYQALSNSTLHPNVRVFQYDRSASNLLFFNLDHTVLSNRYVRQAIAHAIDYEHIFDNILPDWGIETAYRGLTPIVDAHYYTDESNETVHLYNDNLQPYQTNITQAIKYMEMWYYSQVGTDYTKGPVGDADFSGFVGIYDFYIWRECFGKTTGQIWFEPGQDVDPDFDNSDLVDIDDFYKWVDNFGRYYSYKKVGVTELRDYDVEYPAIMVVPETIVDPTLQIGENFTVSIYTDYNGSDIWGWQFSLTYNPDVLHGVEVTNGDLITTAKDPSAFWLQEIIDNTTGILSAGAFFLSFGETVPVTNGPGTLANVTFKVVGTGESHITLGPETKLFGYGYDIVHEWDMPNHVQHGYFARVRVDIPIPSDGNATIEGNVNITKAVVRKNILHFDVSGPSGSTGWINVTFPMINTTNIQVKVDHGPPLTPPPFPIITSNGTHYFIYFEFTLSTHEITIQYAVVDMSVTNVTASKTVVSQNFTMSLNVTVENQGDFTENFNVTTYANTTIIATLTNITLSSGNSTTIALTWNTTGVPYGNCTISANATILEGETDIVDNTLIDGWIVVTIAGDADGSGWVVADDFFLLVDAFGSRPGDSNWNPNCDFDDSGRVVADDFFILVDNFGERAW